jgi:HK97 family phage major capsid protein
MKLPEYRTAIKSKCEEVQAIFRKADLEQNGICSTEQQEQIKSLNKQIEELEQSAQSLAQQDELKALNGRRLDAFGRPGNPQQFDGTPAGAGRRGSIGERFLASDAFKAWFDSVAPHGQVPERMRITSPSVPFNGEGVKSLLTGLTTWSARTDTSASALVPIDQRGLLDMGYWQRPLRISDLVSHGTTTGDVIEYVRITGVTNNAAPVAEATATGGSSGVKPESAMAFEVIQDRVKTIATWLPATRRALGDAGQLRSLIDAFLRYALLEELEDQMVSGSGAGENLTGVLNVSGILTQSWSADLLTTARKAITNITLNGRVTPNAWVLHPNDWEDFDLLTDNENRYFFGGPQSVGTPRLWGVPVIVSEAVTEGFGVLADWSKAMLWDREQTNILVSDSHADFFIRNLIAILGELRAAFGVIRPKAFLKADWTE